jgi:hypothetical protein
MDLGTQIVGGILIGVAVAVVAIAIRRRSESPYEGGFEPALPRTGPGDLGVPAGGGRRVWASLGVAALVVVGLGGLYLEHLRPGLEERFRREEPAAPSDPAASDPAPPDPAASDPTPPTRADAPAAPAAPACDRLASCCAVAGARRGLQGMCDSLGSFERTSFANGICGQLLAAAPRLLAIDGDVPPECVASPAP